MKKAKKIFAVVAATIMVLSMGMVSVNAADVQPRGALCPACGGTVRTTVTYSTWKKTDNQRRCRDGYHFGTDLEYQRKKYTHTECVYCHRGGDSTQTEIMWECHGYN